MPEKDQKSKKYGFAEILKKAVLGCGGECGEGCGGCCNEIKIVPKETKETEEND
ncbi:hypothetical protein L0665_06425 [Methanogenium marinum]|uniref:Uncharacterized protein n=1 Tax=Methanogenium marinum TaxID=348610 RepID=A0A9Q4KU01_9EURY|nr:hypothetical protein [Methanogenium marinum]MDE4908243.1 hypothetical protein [Methanogenium marinum]